MGGATLARVVRHRRSGRAVPWLLWACGIGVLAYHVASDWGSSVGYDLLDVRLAGQALSAHRVLYGIPQYSYPPSAAVLLGLPLSAVSFATVQHVALVAGPALVVATVVLAARTVGRRPGDLATGMGVAGVSLVAFVPEAIGLENASMLIGCLSAGAFLCWARQREVASGVLLGLSIAVKPILLPLCIALLVLRRWGALAAAAAVVAAPSLAALAVDPHALGNLGSVLRDVLEGQGAFSGYFLLFNSAVRSVGILLGWNGWLTTGLRLLVLAAAVAGALAVWRRRPEPARTLEAAGLLLAGSWLASASLEAHWLLALIPFAYAAVVPGSMLRWWPVTVGALFASELVVLPHQLTRYGTYGTDAISLGLGLCLVVLGGAVVSVWPALHPESAAHRSRLVRLHRSAA